MIDSNKLSGFIERVEGDFRPVTADIFLTDFCNNSCGYCRYNHKTGKYIHFEDFVALTAKLQEIGVKGFILTGGGEPTINPDFEKICSHLEQKGIPYGINTNFNFLRYIAPVFLKVSIDEGTPEGYFKTRGVNAFEKVLDNIRKYIEWKNANGKKTRVGVQCVTTNPAQALDFYAAVKSLDVNYIQFRPVEMQSQQYDYSAICDAVDSLASKDARVIKSYKYGLSTWRPKECFAYWSAICVTSELNVIYCCHRPDEIIGNVFDADLLQKLREYRPDMSKCETPCRLTGANAYVMQYRKDGDRYFI